MNAFLKQFKRPSYKAKAKDTCKTTINDDKKSKISEEIMYKEEER